ncbi:MAG: thioredoxin family protein [Planctomycetia bacterium]
MGNLRPHPHFNDRGTLQWQTRYQDALQLAKAANKPIFIEFGREQCSQCRSLVEIVIPRPDIAPLLQQNFVALASDCDECEDEVMALAAQIEDAYMLPFVILADAHGKFLAGTSGVVAPASLKALLERHSPDR